MQTREDYIKVMMSRYPNYYIAKRMRLVSFLKDHDIFPDEMMPNIFELTRYVWKYKSTEELWSALYDFHILGIRTN